MRRFVPALRRIRGELSVPEPAKSRIILEMASDLEALYDHYRSRGVSDDEAARLVEEKLIASPEALRHLVAVHTTAYGRFVTSATGALRWGFNLLLFVVGVVPMLAMSVHVTAVQLRAADATPALWPLLLIAVAMAVIALGRARQLFLARDVSPRTLHRGLPTLVVLGVIAPVIGAIAFIGGLRNAALAAMAGGAMPLEAVRLIARDGTLLSLGLLLGIGAGLVWFVLVNRIAAVEQAESDALLAGD